jgi:elongation factor 1-beta
MGEVMVVMRIMPDSVDRDLNKLEEDLTRALPSGAKIQGYQVKPIAFGLKALICAVLVSDDVGGSAAIEHAFSSVEGVQSLEVEQQGRVL